MLLRLTPRHSVRFISLGASEGPEAGRVSVVRTLHCTVSASRMHELPIDSVRQLKLDRCTSLDSLHLNLTIT